MNLRSTLRTVSTSLALAFFVDGLAGANVLVVDAAGGGAFTQISAAVAAAADGDVLLVKTGTYGAVSIVDKALDVVAEIGSNVLVQGGVTISALAASRSVTLTGMRIEGPAFVSSKALILNACAGSIRVQGCEINGFDAPNCVWHSHGGHAVDVTGCLDVAFARCTLLGGDAGDVDGSGYAGDGGDALRGSGAQVALYDCTLLAADGGGQSLACSPLGAYAYGGDGGTGARFHSGSGASNLFFSDCSVRGGAMGDVSPSGYGGCGGSGLSVSGASPSLVRSLESSYLRGNGMIFCLQPHENVAVEPPSTFTTLTGVARRLTATRLVREQHAARIDVFGEPGDQVRLVMAEAPRFLYLDAWRGVSLVRRPHPSPVLLLGTLDASGTSNYSWVVPDLGPGAQSRRLFLQAEFVDVNGQKTVSTPATFVLLDSAF